MNTTAQQPAAFELTECGNAERFAARHGTKVRYVWAWQKWVCWNGTRWVVDDLGAVERLGLETFRTMKEVAAAMEVDRGRADALWSWAHQSESRRRLESMLALAQSDPAIAARPEQFDTDRMLLGCANGVIDLRTGRLRQAQREDLLTKQAPVAFDPQAAAPLWDKFLERILDGNRELICYVQRIAGLALTGDITDQALYLFHGAGANGKSVFLDTLLGLMGDYGGTAPDSLLTIRANQEHPTEIADLCGKRLVVASETEDGARLRVQLVKRLTGDQTLKARFMRQDYFEFPRTHKLILVTNSKPVIRDTGHAIWRRIRLVPFTVTIPPEEQDPNLIAKLRSEWPGILAWAVRGCLDWQRNGMQTPAEVKHATTDYQADQDPLAEFLSARCILMDGARVGRSDLWTDYLTWAKASGERHPLERGALYDTIRRVPGVTESQWRQAGNPIRGFVGVGLCATNPNS